MNLDADVVIVGAGVAGLSAARLLSECGLDCLILEGGTTVGGRLRTLRKPGWHIPIELGAEFVHGRPGPLLALDGGALNRVHVAEQRVKVEHGNVQIMDSTWPHFARAMKGALAGPDRTVAEYLRAASVPPSEQRLIRMLVEGYHAADLNLVSAQDIAEDAANTADEFQQFRTADGYDQVLSALVQRLIANRTTLRLGSVVHRVEWSHHAVQAHGQSRDDTFTAHARSCLVTCSLGVLGSGNLRFDPEPAALQRALGRLGMGSVVRLVLRMQRPPWPHSPSGIEPTFVHVPGAPFPTLWRETRAGQTHVTAWAAGPQAAPLLGASARTLTDAALQSLAQATSAPVGECHAALLAAHHHDYNRDPLTLGAYSYARPGGRAAARALLEPNDDTLYFAGEALDLEYPGTVAGALGSGEHAARLLLRNLRNAHWPSPSALKLSNI